MGLPITTTPSGQEQEQEQHRQGGTTQQGGGGGAPCGAGVDTGAGITRAKTQAEEEADRLYEERMEDEYAKREGGA